MKVGQFKEICRLVSACGLVDEFSINENGHFIGTDSGKTFIADLEYPHNLPVKTNIINVKGMMQTFNLFKDDVDVELVDGRIKIDDGITFASIVLSAAEPTKFNLPPLTDDDYDIIVNKVNHKSFNDIARLRPEAMINEYYFLFTSKNRLMLHIGEDSGSFVGTKITDLVEGDKSDDSKMAKYTMNVSECFKNIKTDASIKIIADKIMTVNCAPGPYNVTYYLAPRVD